MNSLKDNVFVEVQDKGQKMVLYCEGDLCWIKAKSSSGGQRI